MKCDATTELPILPKFYLYTKELSVLARSMVKKVQRFPMLISETFSNPDDHMCIKSAGVCQKLPKVGMVSLSKLVLNYNLSFDRSRRAPMHIQFECSNFCFNFQLILNPDPNLRHQFVEILSKPWREMTILRRPYLPYIHLLDRSQL